MQILIAIFYCAFNSMDDAILLLTALFSLYLLWGQFHSRVEIVPDQRERYLQRLKQVQHQGQSNLLGMPSLTGGIQKPLASHQQNSLLQPVPLFSYSFLLSNLISSCYLSERNFKWLSVFFYLIETKPWSQLNSPGSLTAPQAGLGPGLQKPSLSTATVATLLLQPSSIHQMPSPQASASAFPKDSGTMKNLIYVSHIWYIICWIRRELIIMGQYVFL